MAILCSACGRPNHVAVFCRQIFDKVINSGEKTNTFPAKGNRNKNYNNKKSNFKRNGRDESDGDKKAKKTKIKVTRNEVESEDDYTHVCVIRASDSPIEILYWTDPDTDYPQYLDCTNTYNRISPCLHESTTCISNDYVLLTMSCEFKMFMKRSKNIHLHQHLVTRTTRTTNDCEASVYQVRGSTSKVQIEG